MHKLLGTLTPEGLRTDGGDAALAWRQKSPYPLNRN
ncbi:hypothetical protein ABIA31_007927 [Catenulispora sp. MAP5-51]